MVVKLIIEGYITLNCPSLSLPQACTNCCLCRIASKTAASHPQMQCISLNGPETEPYGAPFACDRTTLLFSGNLARKGPIFLPSIRTTGSQHTHGNSLIPSINCSTGENKPDFPYLFPSAIFLFLCSRVSMSYPLIHLPLLTDFFAKDTRLTP